MKKNYNISLLLVFVSFLFTSFVNGQEQSACSLNKISNGTFQEDADGWKDANNQPPAASVTNYKWYRFSPNRDLRISAKGAEQTLTTTAVEQLCVNTPKLLTFGLTPNLNFREGSYLKILVGGMVVFSYNLHNSKFQIINGVTAHTTSNDGLQWEVKIQNYQGNSDEVELKFYKPHGLILNSGYIAIDNIKLYEKPTLKVTPPNAMSFCVNNIISANYNETTNGDVNNPPDYYQFSDDYAGLDVDIDDDCCATEKTISWEITPTSNGISINGTGQPSETIGGKKLWLDVAPNNPKSSYVKKEYTITYMVTGYGNTVIKTTQITIKPRPKITRVNN